MSRQADSLVKYETPILVSKSLGKTGAKSGDNSSAKTSASSLPSDSSKTEDYLNSILPPNEYEKNGQLWLQYVSPIPATRLDVCILQQELDKKLQERQARETGICPIREDLYAQTFDEIIRQVTINCAERGFLLVRVRDEVKMTILAYQTLYESSIAYGMRKAMQAEQSKAEKLNKIAALKQMTFEQKDEINQLREKIDAMLEDEEADKIATAEQHAADYAAEFDRNQAMAVKLKEILSKLQGEK